MTRDMHRHMKINTRFLSSSGWDWFLVASGQKQNKFVISGITVLVPSAK